ncbi:c-type cytochrome [Cyclobacterium amurskyense]|uniref:c-type cytochrome n=1 Tax=Cyclobacterium amurskyense TaxID=320787 RepID=UPI0030DC33B4|tara:strand:+ start:73 stop:1053 length:981 start_codon:yes stop_codon:yes gene_type:complete
MNKYLKLGLFFFSFLLILIIGSLVYIQMILPDVGNPPENMKLSTSSETLNRGKYLANHVMICIDCHSQRDFSLFSGPPIPGTEGSGGEVFDHAMGFPGTFISPNITPAHLTSYSDGELFRLITTGVKKDGDPIFPIMPYANYGKMDKEDILSVIAYIRTLSPIEKVQPTSEPDFPFSLIMRTIPQRAEFSTRPPESDAIAYGKYLVNAAACNDCHTKFENGKYTGEHLAGGRVFNMPDGNILTSPNLTPHKTGLGNWTKEQFIERFKQYEDRNKLGKVQAGEMQTIMPWNMYAGMTVKDLGAIYTYIQSLKPVDNQVNKFLKAESL